MALTANHSAGDAGHVTDHNLIDATLPTKADLVSGVIPKTQLPPITKTDVGLSNVDNVSAASLRDRSTHTGTQAASTVTGLAAVATSGAKADVGLGNVDNTSDVNKPVSTAQQTALSARVPLWQPNTAYAAGQPVINPDGELVKALAAFTSGATYDATKWSAPASGIYARKAVLPVSVKDFGAVGDGIADDGPAFVAAMASSGRKVYVPPGTYFLSSTLVVPVETQLVGAGPGTYLRGAISCGSDVTVTDLKVGDDNKSSRCENNARRVRFDNVHFFKGSSAAIFSLNDSNVQDVYFLNCRFSDNAFGNGVQIVDKGTLVKHYEDISFVGCLFYNNARMNFECIQRSDAGNPVVQGYRSIDLINCVFKPITGAAGININVSYDSGTLTADTTTRSSGFSQVQGCIIMGSMSASGGICLELAGPGNMRIANNEIKNGGLNSEYGTAAGTLMSVSQNSTLVAFNTYTGNQFSGVGDVTIQGGKNLVSNNIVRTNGRFRFNPAFDSDIRGNYVDCVSPQATAVSVENGFLLRFHGNTIRGGANQTILNIGTGATHNSYVNNFLHNFNAGIDVRDGVFAEQVGNKLLVGSSETVPREISYTPQVSVLPTATVNNRGTFRLVPVSGAADQLWFCTAGATSGTFVWKQVTLV